MPWQMLAERLEPVEREAAEPFALLGIPRRFALAARFFTRCRRRGLGVRGRRGPVGRLIAFVHAERSHSQPRAEQAVVDLARPFETAREIEPRAQTGGGEGEGASGEGGEHDGLLWC